MPWAWLLYSASSAVAGASAFFKSRAADHTQQANRPGLSSTQRAASRDDAWVSHQAAKNWSKKTNRARGV